MASVAKLVASDLASRQFMEGLSNVCASCMTEAFRMRLKLTGMEIGDAASSGQFSVSLCCARMSAAATSGADGDLGASCVAGECAGVSAVESLSSPDTIWALTSGSFSVAWELSDAYGCTAAAGVACNTYLQPQVDSVWSSRG